MFRIISLRLRSLLKTATCYLEDSVSFSGLITLIRGREPGCSYVVPRWRREPWWVLTAAVVGFVLPLATDARAAHLTGDVFLPDSSWYALAAMTAAIATHRVLDAWVFDGHHMHCDNCDNCSLDVGGRTFADRRNAIAFTISELGWCIGAKRTFAYCPCTDDWPDDYPFRPATGTTGSEPA